MKTGIYIAMAAMMAFAVNFAYGQDSETANQDRQLNRQVDVSRDYAPDVEGATKLAIIPNMNDTTLLRPQFDHALKTHAWRSGGFGVTAINPVDIDASLYNPIYPYYLKIGVGIPIQTTLDFYGVSRGKRGIIGGYINHEGKYAKIKNDFGRKSKAVRTINSIGGFGSVDVGRRMSLAGELGLDYNLWSMYGYGSQASAWDAENKIENMRYTTPRAKLSFGNDFKDLSRFNFRVGLDAYGFVARDSNLGDDNTLEIGGNFFVQIGKMFSVHQLELKLSYDYFTIYQDGWLGGENRDFRDDVVTLSPRYGIKTKRFKLSVGADLAYDIRSSDDETLYILPQLSVSFDALKGWLVPYIRFDSRLTNNGLRSMAERNPYVGPDVDIPETPTTEFALSAGIQGAIYNNFAYRVYVGWSYYDEPVYFYKYDDGETRFDMITDDNLIKYTLGVELDGRISRSFTAGLSANLYNYNTENLDYAVNCPKSEASLYVKYSNRDKFSIKLGVEVIGKRHFMTQSSTMPRYIIYPSQKAVVDITLEAEYFVKRGFALFLTAENLANSKLYRFHQYPEHGIGAIAGIKLIF